MDAKELVIGDIVEVINVYIFLYVTLMSSILFSDKRRRQDPCWYQVIKYIFFILVFNLEFKGSWMQRSQSGQFFSDWWECSGEGLLYNIFRYVIVFDIGNSQSWSLRWKSPGVKKSGILFNKCNRGKGQGKSCPFIISLIQTFLFVGHRHQDWRWHCYGLYRRIGEKVNCLICT